MLDSCYQHLDNQGFSSSMYDTQVCAASCNCNFYWNCFVAFYLRTTQQVLITSAFQIELDGICKCWFLRRGEKRSTLLPPPPPPPPPPPASQKKQDLAEQGKEPTTTSSHILRRQRDLFEPGPHRWETSALTTAPPSALSGRIKRAQCNSWDFGLFFNF